MGSGNSAQVLPFLIGPPIPTPTQNPDQGQRDGSVDFDAQNSHLNSHQVWCAIVISVLGRQRQADLWDLHCSVNSSPVRAPAPRTLGVPRGKNPQLKPHTDAYIPSPHTPQIFRNISQS